MVIEDMNINEISLERVYLFYLAKYIWYLICGNGWANYAAFEVFKKLIIIVVLTQPNKVGMLSHFTDEDN